MKRRPLRMPDRYADQHTNRGRKVVRTWRRLAARWERRTGKRTVEAEEEETRVAIHTTGIFVRADDVTQATS